MRTSTTLPALVLAVGATLAAGPAQAAPGPACGDTLTQDTVLTRNLTCPSGDGLWLEPGVTLDLGGKVLAGHDGGSGVVAPSTGDVAIVNGVIAGWGTGVTGWDPGQDETGAWPELSGTVLLDGVVIRGARIAVWASGRLYRSEHKHVDIVRSTLRNNVFGLMAFGSSARFDRSTVRDSRYGVFGRQATIALDRSVVRGNTVGYWSTGETTLTLTSTALLFNTKGLSPADGDVITIDSSDVRGHDLALDLAGRGASVELTATTLTRNEVAVHASDSLRVEGSTFHENDVAVTVTDGGSGGVADPVEVVGSTFSDGGDGLVAEVPGVRVGGSTATGNARHGIHAPGAIDLGGNTASGNGTEPQCVGVSCTPGG
ncbi:hypothetical protein [Cellulomonas oligotrophica]|uniref:Right handed beta helix domain-containing protein n=1 Tax=Cellulomonas oligotrophica TaxID=931536 RepID=A0A7Y9FGU3_9CELL|nr:hypothetical protein [Cellulomonas oligotrophica]NYD86970.1 hypothetical protein [Cellulomonas oligotrophica]GIG32244.1 hypothetical protein Col01nite_14030 [Cellulomonas oligotrophica]